MDAAPYVEALARRYMRAQARFWCGGTKGRGKLDPIYVQVTQGRDPEKNWHGWSSCGELPQALVEHMGCDLPFVNRAPHWRDGRNLLDFYDVKHVPSAPAVPPAVDYQPGAGDIGFIWLTGTDAHTFVFGDMLDDGHVETFNYGAGGMQAVEFPGCHQSASKYERHGAQIYVGTRILHEVLTVPRLLSLIATAKLPPMSGDIVAELEGRIAA